MTTDEKTKLKALTAEMQGLYTTLRKPDLSEAERRKLNVLDTLAEFENHGFTMTPQLRPDVPKDTAKLYYALWKLV